MHIIPFDAEAADNHYHQHYNQTGAGGGISVFRGGQYQRGYGIGSIFGSLIRSALPLVKQGVKALGKSALRTGLRVASDGLRGKNLRQSLKDNARVAGSELIRDSLDSMMRSRGNKRRRRAPRPVKCRANSKAKRRRLSAPLLDIFS